jgi:DNA-binding protein H-NS
MAEEKESIYDKIRREAREKQEAERERRARVREVMEKGNTPSWLQKLNR